MAQDISNKIENIQRNFSELNNMFELSIIANQSADLSDFINKVSEFITSVIGVKDVLFFLPEGEIFTVVNGSTFIELSDNNDGFWKLLQEGELIRFVSSNGEILYKSFIESNGLKKIDTHYLKGFNREGSLISICSLGAKENDVHLDDEECIYLNKILNYVEPILHKFIKRDAEQTELRKLYKAMHNVSILYNISQAMNFIDDLKRLLNIILDKALETIDECVQKVVEAIEEKNGVLLITADHGNSEQMLDYKTGEPHTAHTTNPVPLAIIGMPTVKKLKEGRLADLAPTMLDIMNLEKPDEMTGESLLER